MLVINASSHTGDPEETLIIGLLPDSQKDVIK